MTDAQQRSRSFGRVAANYHRYRPRTPVDMLDWLLPPDARRVVDLAAGTGTLTELLAARVAEVIAVEPDREMRSLLTRAVPAAHVVAAMAEAVPLRAGSIDAVLVSSAWHWFDADRASAEICRVLSEGGRLALVGNTFDLDIPWVAALRQPIVTSQRSIPAAARPELPESAPLGPLETRALRWTWRLRRGDLLGLLGTYSKVIVADPEEQDAMRRHALAVLDREPATRGREVIDLPMRTYATRTHRLRRSQMA